MQIIVYIKRSDLLKLYDPVEKYKIPVMPTLVVSYLSEYDVAIIINLEEYDFPNKRLVKPKDESK